MNLLHKVGSPKEARRRLCDFKAIASSLLLMNLLHKVGSPKEHLNISLGQVQTTGRINLCIVTQAIHACHV